MTKIHLLSAVATLLCCLTATAQTSKPNVIIVLTDDQGYGDLSCHGNPALKTPNLDRLHAESVRLTDFHVAPMCTPTRGQLMTGMDALRNGASSVTAGRSFMRRGIPTMPEIFAANGYRTALFGKWHLGDSWPYLPNQRGFQEAVYHMGWGIQSIADYWLNDNFDDWYRHNGALKQYKGYCTDIWFDLAMDWMKQRQQRQEPFFLYLPANAPHGPAWVSEKYSRPYQGKGPAEFFGMIANLDENFGRLEAFLRETGLRDNTVVIFFNDNGGTRGVNLFNAGMRGRKTQYYEGGHRAACFVRWPQGKLRAPGDVNAPAQVQDLLPTLTGLLKLTLPKAAKFDGVSLAGLLRGAANALSERMLVVQYGQNPAKWDSAVIWNKWRLVKGEELYDLTNDPGQQNNVAAQHADALRKMRAHYEKWWAGVEPLLNDFSPISIGSDHENPVTLTSVDWANVYCDNVTDLRAGVNRNGPWHLQVEKSGSYEISLRRWPKEADAPIASAVPEFKDGDRQIAAGRALPVVKARLKIGSFDESRPVTPPDKAVSFTVPLSARSRLQMQSWFYDDKGQELCGAYYAYVRRK